ncbi:MAG TPA: methyltransferase domain-containing protein [Gammaproteobacteria bacterium]|nr:methyltransferase domain-containing protein [Gammaproteobacteria bacterium]
MPAYRPSRADTVDTSKPFLLFVAFTEGAAVMVAELVGAKMLTPLYGSSLYVWGSILGTTLVALSAGYFLGGLLSHRKDRETLLFWCMTLAALFISLMPLLASNVMFAFDGIAPIPAVILLCALYLLPPLILLGATTPMIINIISSHLDEAGTASGTVYAVSTCGGILATLSSGFLFIPEYGLTATAQATGFILILLPVYVLLKKGQVHVLALPVVALLTMVPSEQKKDSPVSVLYQSEGLLGQIMVVDVPYVNRDTGQKKTDRILFVNRMGQTWVTLKTGKSNWDYFEYIASASSVLPADSSALLLGLGGGILAGHLQNAGFRVDAVELDERIMKTARKYFGMKENGDVIVDDGRHLLRISRKKYDLIVFDVFKAEIPPPHLLTVEAFREARDMLTPDGFVIVNFNGFIDGDTGYGGRSLMKTLIEAGFHVNVLPTRADESHRNNIFLATKSATDFDSVRVPLVLGGQRVPLRTLFLDQAEIDLENAEVLVDDRPILDKFNIEAAATWRKDYTETFTRKFSDMGIPLFE